MPTDHQKYLEWGGNSFRKWAAKIGINTDETVNGIPDADIYQYNLKNLIGGPATPYRRLRCSRIFSNREPKIFKSPKYRGSHQI